MVFLAEPPKRLSKLNWVGVSRNTKYRVQILRVDTRLPIQLPAFAAPPSQEPEPNARIGKHSEHSEQRQLNKVSHKEQYGRHDYGDCQPN
jgi:hypothetical protein